VFGFAKQSGGEVVVASEVGKGSTFTLYLPRVSGDSIAPALSVSESPVVDGHGMSVLVVEDNRDVGTFATDVLSELGYITVLRPNAREALVELARHATRYDVVFSDVVMPGMTGIELAQEIRKLYPDLPVVLTSGYSHVLAQNGTFGFELLHKPYSVEQLSRVLTKAGTWRKAQREAA
jgi:CheY-like chemotaxis protein